MMKHRFVAIDPGATGGIVWYDDSNLLISRNMPDSLEGFISILRSLGGYTVYLENVGTYMPGNSGPAAVTFARHCGQIDGVLETLGMKTIRVRPQEWMKSMPLTKFDPIPRNTPEADRKKELGKRKIVRKNEIKEYVAARFPLVKVTLKNSDSLGLLLYATTKAEEELPL